MPREKDINQVFFKIDQVSKSCGAASVFEFPENAMEYRVVYNFESYAIMVVVACSLSDIRVSTETGVRPAFSEDEGYDASKVLDNLRNLPKSVHENWQKAREKQKEINDLLSQALK